MFKPVEFINNVPYMLKGMFGLFIALGIIALTTIALNKLTEKK